MSTEPTMRDRVAEEVRSLLARRRMSASELARRMETTQRYISRRLTGETAFDVDDLGRIAAILDVQIADLLPRAEEGRLITTAAPRGGTGAGTNVRSSRLSDWPHTGGHASRTPRPASTTRPSRLRPAHA